MRRWLWLVVLGAVVVGGQASGAVAVRRTADGIPHVKADNWHDLGVGVGHAQASDALCTLAEAFVTFEGRRAYFFGPDAQPSGDATFGRSKNLDLDFFFRAVADDTVVTRYRAEQPPDLVALIEGFADGYNRHLREVRHQQPRGTHRACRDEPWVREISADDIYRRMFAANIAAGYSRFVKELAQASPGRAAAPQASVTPSLRDRLALRVGDQPGIGSNMLAFGGEATGGDGAVLLGNPHWYWGGPDRFYQMHLTIPGQLDVAGVAFLGIPVVMIGFNRDVAWSHTVSEARRFGLFDLAVDPADPTRYRVDGEWAAMDFREVVVPLREGSVSRTLYRTRFGPVVDLGAHHEALGWRAGHALAVRDVNADNFRVFRNFFFWNQAKSLDDFIAIQRREAAVPWVNTSAIARGDGRVWYADIGAVPNVTDVHREACATPKARMFATLDASTPFLDGTRSACDWPSSAGAVQPGTMPTEAMPSLLRGDYVANMNGSYWLNNVHQPLTGYPAVMGGERQALSLRSRLGHRMAIALASGGASSSRVLGERVMHDALWPRAHSAELFKADLLAAVCADPAGRVAEACRVLRQWPDTANAGDRGALLWDTFWRQLAGLPEAERYRVAFSADAPLDTPRAANGDDPRVGDALRAAVAELDGKGWPLDTPLRGHVYMRSGAARVPMYGGCHEAGYFVIACRANTGGADVLQSHANTYLQVVRFGPRGPEAYTLLSHGEPESTQEGGTGLSAMRRYARKDWLRFPFDERDIERDPAAQTRQLVR